MLPVSLIVAIAAAQSAMPMHWAEFSRSPSRSRVVETVYIETGDRQNGTGFGYTLRLMRKMPGSKAETKWANSATCPAVRPVIANMRNISMPSPAPYGIPDDSITITADGTAYFLAAPSSDNMGRITLKSNSGSSLAAWIDDAFEQLEPCWAKRP